MTAPSAQQHFAPEASLPVGAALPDWQAPVCIPPTVMQGRYCRLEPLDYTRHAEDLFAAYQADASGRGWTYLPYGPFTRIDAFTSWLADQQNQRDPQFYAIAKTDVSKSGTAQQPKQACGLAAYLRITPEHGSIEVGHIHFSPDLQRQVAATEAMFLMMQRAFKLGYRRYEWKCDALNAPSRRAAERLGFVFEGVFRQAMVIKGRNRDTAWFAIIDSAWPALEAAFNAWLAADNFDGQGQQMRSLWQCKDRSK